METEAIERLEQRINCVDALRDPQLVLDIRELLAELAQLKDTGGKSCAAVLRNVMSIHYGRDWDRFDGNPIVRDAKTALGMAK